MAFDDGEGLDGRVPPRLLVGGVQGGDEIGALGRHVSEERHAFLAEEEAIFRVGDVLVSACGDGVGFVPCEQIPIAASLSDEIVEIVWYLLLAAPQIDVDAFQDPAAFIENLQVESAFDVFEFLGVSFVVLRVNSPPPALFSR